jgi:hypothetical protein
MRKSKISMNLRPQSFKFSQQGVSLVELL